MFGVVGGGRWCGGEAARPRIERGGCSSRLERRKDKAERLRGLTERLRTTEPPTELPRLQLRPVLGAYVQRTIPFRSASFSQVDCSPDGKYVRSRAAAQATKAQREEEQRDRKIAVHSPPGIDDLRSITEEEEKPKNGPSSSWFGREEPSSPEEEITRPRLVTQSSDERDEGRNSPYSDSERTYAKRPLRGPYGMMLEAEMSKGREREVHHQRTTSSPSQLEGCARPSNQILAQLLKGSSERSLSQPSSNTLLPKVIVLNVFFYRENLA